MAKRTSTPHQATKQNTFPFASLSNLTSAAARLPVSAASCRQTFYHTIKSSSPGTETVPELAGETPALHLRPPSSLPHFQIRRVQRWSILRRRLHHGRNVIGVRS